MVIMSSCIHGVVRMHPTVLHEFLPEMGAVCGDDFTLFPGVCFRVVFHEHFTSGHGAGRVRVVRGRTTMASSEMDKKRVGQISKWTEKNHSDLF